MEGHWYSKCNQGRQKARYWWICGWGYPFDTDTEYCRWIFCTGYFRSYWCFRAGSEYCTQVPRVFNGYSLCPCGRTCSAHSKTSFCGKSCASFPAAASTVPATLPTAATAWVFSTQCTVTPCSYLSGSILSTTNSAQSSQCGVFTSRICFPCYSFGPCYVKCWSSSQGCRGDLSFCSCCFEGMWFKFDVFFSYFCSITN